MRPTVAIITRAKDEMPHARRAMEALESQTLKADEFIAVDSGSTDGTFEALAAAGADLERIKPEDYAPGKVLNAAIQRAHGDLIVLLNADAVPLSNDWLERLIAPIIAGEADATFSKQIARADARFIVKDDYARAYDPARTRPDFFSAVACAFRRSLWERQPFRETGYAEDAEWAEVQRAKGARFQLVAESIVEHSHDYSLKALYQKRYRQALAFTEKPRVTSCLKEIFRDAARAMSRLQAHTIPYNVAYRVTIHRAAREGARARRA